MGTLSYNQQEIEQAATLWPGQVWLGDQASEQHLKDLNAKGPYLLHFATHALAEDKNPMLARLYLSTDTAHAQDGILHGYEIYGLRLPSKLTVLSACQTGLGPLARGEGIMSLARAFRYAGSEQLLTTLWTTDDRSAAKISAHFFEGLKSGARPSEALTESQRQYFSQADPFHRHPFFWGGMVLIGADEVIESPWMFPWQWSFGTILFLTAVAAIWYRLKSPSRRKIL